MSSIVPVYIVLYTLEDQTINCQIMGLTIYKKSGMSNSVETV